MRAFATWRFAPVTATLLVIALIVYLAAVIAARRADTRWSLYRTVVFTAGLAVAGAAIMGSPGVYGDGGLFWMHMIEHLMLIMIAPALLCLGHPMTLPDVGHDVRRGGPMADGPLTAGRQSRNARPGQRLPVGRDRREQPPVRGELRGRVTGRIRKRELQALRKRN